MREREWEFVDVLGLIMRRSVGLTGVVPLQEGIYFAVAHRREPLRFEKGNRLLKRRSCARNATKT